MVAVQTHQGPAFLPRAALSELVAILRSRGYTVIAPKASENCLLLGEIETADEIARGLSDEQEGGHYRLIEGDPDLSFEYVVGMNSAKGFLFPPTQQLYQFHIDGERFMLDAGPPQVPKLAFLGIRPCDLAAMRVQDRAFGAEGPAGPRCESEVYYSETRRQAILIVINCTRPGGTCFCASMKTGPEATDGYDLALTELRAGFLVQAGTPVGRALLQALPVREPTSAELELAELKLLNAREHMGRRMNVQGLREMLNSAIDHPVWEDVARRCLSCGNCTMVCPTCFCSTVSDSNSLEDGRITRTRQWESCFTHQSTYTTAGPVRNTIRGRYRHWLRHKLCTWFDQFSCSGCVGCGRCITWCPVGIDLTAEANRIMPTQPGALPQPAEVRP